MEYQQAEPLRGIDKCLGFANPRRAVGRTFGEFFKLLNIGISLILTLFVVSRNMTPDFRMKRISVPRIRCHISGLCRTGKSVSSSDPLSYFGTIKSVRIRNIKERVIYDS